MTAQRPPDFDLAQALSSPGFTPRAQDVPALLERISADESLAPEVERALGKLGSLAVDALLARLKSAPAPWLPRLLQTVARKVGDDAVSSRAASALLSLLPARDGKLRRQAISALGRLGARPQVEDALLDLWANTQDVADLRALASALGKVGGERAWRALKEAPSSDPELTRIVGRSRLILERTQARDEVSRIDDRAVTPAALPIRLHCRAGLERLLLSELDPAWTPTVLGPGLVRIQFAGPLGALFQSRLFGHLGFELLPVGRTKDVMAALGRALASFEALRIFSTFTEGPWRYRLAFTSGGHRRALVWRCAQALSQRVPELKNDPTRSTWEVVVLGEDPVMVELLPRKLEDPRFVYRKRDVPAASHPTLAAAIARAAGVRSDDVVWDPFVGSGSELVERSLLGPCAALVGTDIDPRALEAARANLSAAGVMSSLSVADALSFAPEGVTAILTNPPMGRRVHRGDVGPLLDAFTGHAAHVLTPGGRLSWISPLPERTATSLARAGLSAELRQKVDMGGFFAELQVWRKRA